MVRDDKDDDEAAQTDVGII